MLNEYRLEIEEIDSKMQKLFEERMKVVAKIKEYKIANNLPILNQKREDDLLLSLSNQYQDKETLKYYQEFMLKMFELSKEFQNE